MLPAFNRAAAAIAVGLLACATHSPVSAQKGTGVSVPAARSEPGANSPATPGVQSPWVKSYQSSVRLIAGAEPGSAVSARLLAGVELRLSEGWKTYWRHPGDDGGLPPSFDWSASRNLKVARVLHPAPQRLKTATGISIGYMASVVFPVEIEAVDPTQPVDLALNLDYGICREICVPAEARMRLTLPPSLAVMPPEIATALARVPRVLAAAPEPGASSVPRLVGSSAVLTGPAAALTFEIATGAAGARADLFVEAPDGVYLPMTAKAGEARAGMQRFRIDLKGVEEATKLAGKALRLTITGINGGTEQSWIVR